jgi:hypothetical protein
MKLTLQQTRKEFRVGDTIKMIENCGDVPKGGIFKLIEHTNGKLYANYKMPKKGCCCPEKWRLWSPENIENVIEKEYNGLQIANKRQAKRVKL